MRDFRLLRFAFALACQLVLFVALNRFDDWTLQEMPLRFVFCAMACGIAFIFAATRFPSWLTLRNQALIFWGVAIFLRVAALPLAPGDDFWRYQWEGKIQQAGFNPYVTSPDDASLAGLRAGFPDFYRINHRDFRAIYPPGTELLFAGLSRVSASPLLYKLLFAAADLATAGVLLLLVRRETRYGVAAWYAWNPLVVYSFAGATHFDSLMILPMLAGIWCLVQHEAANDARTKWTFAFAAAALFGIAISIKLIPLLLLPLCVFALRGRAVALVISLAIPAGLSLVYGYPQIDIWDSLGNFAYVTRLNDLFWWIIEETVWPNYRQKNYQYNVVIIGVVLAISLAFFRNWRRGMLWVLGAALILSPVLHPWYLTWILPIAAWRRAQPWQMLSVTLFAYFLFWNERLFALPWHAELWMRGMIILPPLVATIGYVVRARPAIDDLPATSAAPTLH
ncbi:MAG: glycosyltransferase 87 family protein [Verrucomicrobiota bacterium]|nr:glycosyltransferase 87 family protein [Verrucomicrobiota bacterium]